MKKLLSITAASVAVIGMMAGAVLAEAGKAKAKVWPAESIQWTDGPAKGTKTANLWGDMMKGGPYGALIKFEGGLMHPLHTHTQTMKIVVVSGTFVYMPEGDMEYKLGPGSYFLQPAGKKHVSGCAPGAECTFLIVSNDKFDMTVVEASTSTSTAK